MERGVEMEQWSGQGCRVDEREERMCNRMHGRVRMRVEVSRCLGEMK